MQNRSRILTALAVLVCLTWAGSDAAFAPQTEGSQQLSFGSAADAITIPRMLSYQGLLTDADGVPVPDDDYAVVFRFYTAPTGGAAFWNETRTVTTKDGLFAVLLGAVTPIAVIPAGGELYLGMAVAGGAELAPRLRIVSVAYAYKADSAAFARLGPAMDSARVAGNSHLFQGKDTTDLVRPGQGNSVTGVMIIDAAVAETKLADGAVTEAKLAANAVTSAEILDGTIAAADLGNEAVTTAKIADGNVTGAKLNQEDALTGQVLKWTGTNWVPSNDGLGAGDNAWVRVSPPDSVLYTVKLLGIARGGAGNALHGLSRHTHVNLGVACTTSSSDINRSGITVTGGYRNSAADDFATIGGGTRNAASYWDGSKLATIGGGDRNNASRFATVGGGYKNTAAGDALNQGYTTVRGGIENTASNRTATVGGGGMNSAGSNEGATVGGGWTNTASDDFATVGGGRDNTASGGASTVGGGEDNTASGTYSTIPGGAGNAASAQYAFATGYSSDARHSNSAAFNGQTTSASEQTRVGILSKASGTFTIDHPLDPHGKILNHYFIEGPEMLNIYRGSVMLDASGRAEVSLPDYFDALNRNPMVQLTGVGTAEVVYLAEKATGNRFAVGGPAGAKVYWQVTGERKDVSAEVTRRMMPVEQPKTENLAGTMLDDEFLSGCMDQLEREGNAQGIEFRTAGGRQRYERMKQLSEENRRTR